MPSPLPRIVIVGGGFGGLSAAKALGQAPVSVTLVDRRNHHLFQPLLYQVATAGLGAIDIAEPIRRILRRQANTTVLLAEVTGIDVTAREVVLAGGERLPYDFLIVAAGAGHAYFGHDEWEAHAPGLKTIDDALEIRRRILRAFERAELAGGDAERRFWLTITIVGGGPTGAELAGAIAELARHTLARDFRRFDPAETRILLVEAGERILPTYPEPLSRRRRPSWSVSGSKCAPVPP
jgi:NADH:ubiquinone reductase (H+-translocating)